MMLRWRRMAFEKGLHKGPPKGRGAHADGEVALPLARRL